MNYILHNSPDYLELKDLVEKLSFEENWIEREWGYFIYKCLDENIIEISKMLHSDEMIEIYKVKVPSQQIIKPHLHNNSTEYFFGETAFEIIINENPIIIKHNSILEIPPKLAHKSALKNNDYEFFVILVRHDNNPNDKELL